MTDKNTNSAVVPPGRASRFLTPAMTAGRSSRSLPAPGPPPRAAGSRRTASSPTRTAALAELAPLDAFSAFPGPRLHRALRDALREGDGTAFAHLAQRINQALSSGAFRHETGLWEPGDESEVQVTDYLPPTAESEERHRPYFEVLSVTATDPSRHEQARQDIRRLRRSDDPFIYELVQVGCFEEAIVAVLANPELQAIVIGDGFGFRAEREYPEIRETLDRAIPFDPGAADVRDYGLKLATALKTIRPELDVYMLTDRGVESLAGHLDAKNIRRVFYDVEELMELHLEHSRGHRTTGTTRRIFSNLKKYGRRPIGTFHALPVARGKSIFKSNWIRTWGISTARTCFWRSRRRRPAGSTACWSRPATSRRPRRRPRAASARRHVYFGTNGTSTSNKIVVQALLAPGDIVLIDRNCHKSHHYGVVLAGALPVYLEAFPLTAYSMYGARAAAHHQAGAARPEGRGQARPRRGCST